jgi:hypothetical protein
MIRGFGRDDPHDLFFILVGEQTATAMLRSGLSELSECCSHLDKTFDDAFEEFESKHMDA